jgi:DNA-binding transcriptional MerR regulator
MNMPMQDVQEANMLKIGEFSRLSQVTVKTLHHYDEIGLLKPSQIDRFTSYRYYTLDQLPRIHSIMALKDLGLSLEEIALLLLENPSVEDIRSLLSAKQAEAQQRVREEQARLAKIEFRLRQIESEGMMKTVDIVIKRIEPVHVLSVRRVDRTRAEREVAGIAIEEAEKDGRIQSAGGQLVSLYYEEEFQGDYDNAEYCVPVLPTHIPTVVVENAGVFKLRELPAIEAAATYLHQGDYDTLPEKFLFLQRWALENGYKLSGVWRFVWHRGPMHHVDPSEYLTELQHPLEPI